MPEGLPALAPVELTVGDGLRFGRIEVRRMIEVVGEELPGGLFSFPSAWAHQELGLRRSLGGLDGSGGGRGRVGRGELELVEAGVQPLPIQQLQVGTFLPQLSVMEDEDTVCALNRGEPVGDDQGGSPVGGENLIRLGRGIGARDDG